MRGCWRGGWVASAAVTRLGVELLGVLVNVLDDDRSVLGVLDHVHVAVDRVGARLLDLHADPVAASRALEILLLRLSARSRLLLLRLDLLDPGLGELRVDELADVAVEGPADERSEHRQRRRYARRDSGVDL